MNAPPVGVIEQALQSIADHPQDYAGVNAAIREFRDLGAGRLDTARSYNRLAGCTDIERGYLIGLVAARLAFASRPDVIMSGIKV